MLKSLQKNCRKMFKIISYFCKKLFTIYKSYGIIYLIDELILQQEVIA